ncbi:unnamed protein product [Aphanomyces euteiches]
MSKAGWRGKMNEWLATVRHTRLSLSIYKYGNDVATKDQLNEFTAACVAPPNQDRSGATNEETIQQYVAKLHERWASTWEADGPVWRIWANYIVKQPRLVWDSRVQLTSPPHVLARLRPKTSNQEAHTQNFRQTIRTARDVIDGSLEEIGHQRGAVDVVMQRINLFEHMLNAKRSVLQASESDYVPIPSHEVAPGGLHDIENIDDEDHDFSIEDQG